MYCRVSFIPFSTLLFIRRRRPLNYTLSRSPTIVIVSGLRGVIPKAVIVIVNLVNTLLQDRHDVVEGAKTIRIVVAARV